MLYIRYIISFYLFILVCKKFIHIQNTNKIRFKIIFRFHYPVDISSRSVVDGRRGDYCRRRRGADNNSTDNNGERKSAERRAPLDLKITIL